MNTRRIRIMAVLLLVVGSGIAQARIKLVALPERAATVIRLDNPMATLIEEERVLTLQNGPIFTSRSIQPGYNPTTHYLPIPQKAHLVSTVSVMTYEKVEVSIRLTR